MRVTLFAFVALLALFAFGAQADDTASFIDTLDATACEATFDVVETAETAPVEIDAEWLAGGGVQCGDTVCRGRRNTCCNASCGICTEPGGFCTQQVCDGGI